MSTGKTIALIKGIGGSGDVVGVPGKDGTTFIPSVSNGVLSWENNGGLANPSPVNIIGPEGPRGEQGPAGYTPVRGTDYWTAADIAEIKGYVDTAILNGSW